MAAAPPGNGADAELSAYEQVRMKNIERNEKLLEGLGLAPDGSKSQKTSVRVHQCARRQPTERTRSSKRQVGEAADSQMCIAEETSTGVITLGNGQRVQRARTGDVTAERDDLTCSGSWDDIADALHPAAPPPQLLASRPAVVTSRAAACAISQVVFQPRSDDRMMLACGDEMGHVVLWHADREADNTTGLFRFKVHQSGVSGMMWPAYQASCLVTCSMDGSLRRLDVSHGQWGSVVDSGAGDVAFSAMATATHEHGPFWLGTADGAIGSLDLRVPSRTPSITFQSVHERRINTLSVER